MAEREPVSKRTRFEVFKRDAFCCQYCGSHPPTVVLHVDHIHPVAEGGSSHIDNLVTACEPCNLGKGARLLADVPVALKDKAALIEEREEQLRGYTEILQQRLDRIEDEAWDVARVLECNAKLDTYSRANLLSIKRFLERLPLPLVMHAADLALAYAPAHSKPRRFRYFCAVCWNQIRAVEGGEQDA